MLSIVIPVFNEEEAIESSFHRLTRAIRGDVEFIFVNDGSTDNTAHFLNAIEAPGIKVIHFSRNFGHSAAVLAGLEAATGNLVAIIDADMQDPPELIPQMVSELDEGFDVVYGQRLTREGETFIKKITAWFFYRIINLLSSVDIPKDAGDFRVMTREVVDAVLSCEDSAPFVRGLVAWVGFRQCPFPYHREERKLGTTKYPMKKMVKFAWQAISSFSNTPLVFITYLGIGMSVISLAVGIMNGWNSLLFGFVGGNAVTLLMLGIMGLYLGKIIDQVRGRPRYIVKKTQDEKNLSLMLSLKREASDARPPTQLPI